MWLAAVAIREINHDSGSATFRTPAILELWLESTTWGHPFIKRITGVTAFRWCGMPILPMRKTGSGKRTVSFFGFISIMEGRFLAAMFVAPKAVRRGIGKALMQYVQQRYPHLMLEVYQKNQPAIDFYHTGFSHCRLRMSRVKPDCPPGLSAGRWFKRCKCQFRTVVFSSHASAVLPAQPFPAAGLGRSLVSTFTAPFTNTVSG